MFHHLPAVLALDSQILYGMAYGLKGFQYRTIKGLVRKATSMRVLIRRIDGDNVFVCTADTRDQGTALTLDRCQIEIETDF